MSSYDNDCGQVTTMMRRHGGTSSGHMGGVRQQARSNDVDRQGYVVHLDEIG
jgi:hypothetical protein